MSVRQIRVVGDPVLRAKAHPVRRFGDHLETLVEDMVETMHAAAGIGLAAPQVSVSERVIVVELPQDEQDPDSGQLHVLVNPQIARASAEEEAGLEGCLSVPGYVGEVVRHQAVTVKGRDVQGHKIRVKAQGLLARVFQHEIDHLDGVLYIDKLTAPDKIWQVVEGEEELAEARGKLEGQTVTSPSDGLALA